MLALEHSYAYYTCYAGTAVGIIFVLWGVIKATCSPKTSAPLYQVTWTKMAQYRNLIIHSCDNSEPNI
jgi:uncharacterized protein with HEPN domain